MNSIILDCDTGEDDALAILLAVKHKLPLRLVVTSFGNTTVENSARNSADVLHYARVTDVPVMKGSAASLQPHLHYSQGVNALEFVGENGLCNMTLPPNDSVDVLSPLAKKIPDLLCEKVTAMGTIDYIVTGPCTNLARALLQHPTDIKRHVRRLFIMGGALFEPGNTGPLDSKTGKPYAEFNFYCDPHAADVVLNSGIPIFLVSWDTTSKLTVSFERYRKLVGKDFVGEFMMKLMSHFFTSFGLSLGRSFELNDPITVLAAMGLGKFTQKRVRVVTDGLQYGRLIEDPGGTKINILALTRVERERMMETALLHLGLETLRVLG